MGTGVSKGKQVQPVIAAQISVQPAPTLSRSDSTSKDEGTITPKKASSGGVSSGRSNLSTPLQGAGRRQIGSARPGGTISRPVSTLSGRQWSGRGFRRHNGSDSVTNGLPFHRDMDNYDLNASQRSQRIRTLGHLFQDGSPEDDVIFLRLDKDQALSHPPTCCQLCGNKFTKLGIRIPLLLLCGHSYCNNCLEKACSSCDYPSALKCGVCSVVTPLDQPSPDGLPENKALLALLNSKEYNSMTSEKNPEPCAECVHKTATTYCSECSASYCDRCGEKAHEGSRVRAKHKPVSITLKPRPQPTCKIHSGQSCVLYCETENQPMCVLCKFYNQHRLHKYELLNKVASKYTASVSEKLVELEKMEKDLGKASEALYSSVSDINNSARKVQERLEKHFAEMKNSYLAALERREAMLLSLVDRQVDVKQEMLAEMRLEVAVARARVLAAHEEASKVLTQNPVTALLHRRHLDLSLEHALNQTISCPLSPVKPDVPLSLLPDILPGQLQTVGQHGAILQLPPKPTFCSVLVATNTITLGWKVQDQSMNVSSDRTLIFSLHCYADIPSKLKNKLVLTKGLTKTSTPESGFEEMSELSSESNNTFPSIPPSLMGSKNMSLLVQPGIQGSSQDGIIKEESEEQSPKEEVKLPALVVRPAPGKTISSLIPDPIRLPSKKENSTLPHLRGIGGPAPSRLGPKGKPPPTAPGASGGGVLNLPPLVLDKPLHLGSLRSVNTSGVVADTEDNNTDFTDKNRKRKQQRMLHSTSSSSSSLSVTSTGSEVTDYTDLGRFCEGFLFEEIYCGEEATYLYSGAVKGASYYFKVRCHNAAGWGPWSDAVQCVTKHYSPS